ncbi:hypothetical protein COUCH_32490 [Couchioplanes caeruleus]|uniref:hypothetical protein n=1 Tax=Couchioplanes caeruleus TaxID=56438 RepID=UPI0020BE3251|nr:hypothetical protein [Couchioplanes caeruleus]UQU63665.1 hypothetical protein COUCH_32490 [Couchioplanes caeruleus]
MSDTGSWNAFAAPSTGRREPKPDTSWPGGEAQADRSQADRSQADRSQAVREPEFGPAPPATGGRTAFGVTAGPISGNWRNDAPASPAAGLPVRTGPNADAAYSDRTSTDAGHPGWATPGHAAGVRPASGHPFGAEAAPERARHSRPAPSPDRSGPGSFTDLTRPAGTDFTGPGTATGLTRPGVSAGGTRPGLSSERFRPAPPADHDEGIGDFIGGPGREIRPHRAARHPAAAAASAGLPEAPRRSRGVLLAGLALTTAVLLGATVAGVAYFSGPDKDLTSVLELGAGDKSDQRTASAAMEGRTAAGFDLVSAVTRVTVRSEDLGDRLFSVTTADDSGVLPKPVLAQDKVQLYLTPDGDGNATGAVDVVLTTRVTWTLRFSGAADEQILNLQGGRVAGIDMLGGARRTAIQLPAAAGTVPLTVTGAVDELAMTSPAGNPVRVQVKGGAKTVAAGARTLRDVAPGSTLTPKNWATNDRYDVNAEARVTLLSVETVK